MRWRRQRLGRARTLRLMGLALAAPAPAAAINPFLEPQKAIAPPTGYVAMCRTQPSACSAFAAITRAPPRDWEDSLGRINLQVNRHVRQVSDKMRFGQADVWQASGVGRGAAGDCEDIALEKRRLLIDAGAPPDHLLLAVAYGRSGVGLHLLLIARTEKGDFVLDSRTSTITPWSNAPYTWVAIQSPTSPDAWYSL